MLNLMPVHYFWWLEGLPPCQGTALLHSLGGTRAQGATCTVSPVHQGQVCIFKPSS